MYDERLSATSVSFSEIDDLFPSLEYKPLENLALPWNWNVDSSVDITRELPRLPTFIPSQPLHARPPMHRGRTVQINEVPGQLDILPQWISSDALQERDGQAAINSSPGADSHSHKARDVGQKSHITRLACFYCRHRKIRCGGPVEGEGQPCRQCIRRNLLCTYPAYSRRGVHRKKQNRQLADGTSADPQRIGDDRVSAL